jgi:membrane-associated phospholipid phosphatase
VTGVTTQRDSARRRAFAFLGPDFTLFFAFLAILLTVGRIFGAHYVLRLSTMLLPGLVAPGLILVRFIPRAKAILGDAPGARADFKQIALGALRDWMPLVLVTMVFDHLEDYTGIIRKVPIDDYLYRIDLAIFGVEPTVWFTKHYHPLLTDWMASAYGIFFIVPMFLGILLSLRGRGVDFREMATSVMLQMWIGFFLFICFPAGPPRYYPPLHDGPFHAHIPSVLGINDYLQGTWDSYDPLLVRSAFPSLHCSYGLMTLIYAWRFGSAIFPKRPRLFFWMVLPIELSLFVSTVYLRHHWIPDCLMGFILSTTACTLAPWLRRRWPKSIPAEPPAVEPARTAAA